MRHGAWIEAADWAALTPEQRHAALVHASDQMSADPGGHVFALESAAAVWGLPRIESWPPYVTVLAAGPRTRGSRLLNVHVGAPATPVTLRGARVTGVARTVVDLARTGSFVSALAAADHALRHGLCTRGDLVAEARAVRARVRGRPTAQLVVELADGSAMSAGESLSRGQMFLLNLPRPRLQVEVEDDLGLVGVADFGWPGVVGEFDGRTKYGLDRVPAGVDPSEVLWREKQREDRMRRRSRVARWIWADALHARRMVAILAEVGIRPQPRSTWLDLAPRSA
ncbi:hypothetical protein [Oryzobacter telluris]|uniref:hypothetical protein n=1 Tax=Oryzobacter telluris TaxID=3149179 RepID=UPI00370CFC71